MNRWTPEEDALIKAEYPRSSKAELLSKLPGRAWCSINQRAFKLDVSRGKGREGGWTEEEDNLLRKMYSVKSRQDILAALPSRDWPNIIARARKFDLQRDAELTREGLWSAEEDAYLKENYEHGDKQEILTRLKGRTWLSIRQHALYIGLPRRNRKLVEQDRVSELKQRTQKRYGVDSTFQLPEVQAKVRKTNQERRGTDYPLQSPEVREKVRQANQEHYGVDNVFQATEVKEQIAQTNLERYGVANPNQSPEIRAKSTETVKQRYGVNNPFQMVDRVQAGMVDKHGVKFPLQSPEILARTQQTNVERYGTIVPTMNPEIRAKVEQTNLKRFGFRSPLQNPTVKEKIRQTNMERYGVENPATLDEVKAKTRQTNISRYGVPYTLQVPSIRDKGYETAKVNKSFVRSGEEDQFYKYLVMIDEHVQSHVRHPVTKHVIDFYLPRFDLWVQFDGIYWHGKIQRPNASRRATKIIEVTMESDRIQNETIPNLVRFWSDEVNRAVKNDSILSLIRKRFEEKTLCHQYRKRLEHKEEDRAGLHFNPDTLRASDFILSAEPVTGEIVEFIKRYEWLGTIGVNPKWCFTARYSGILGGVVLINEPTAYSKILGEETPRYEALIQRGASASWTPKNLGSRLVSFACRWMVKNTEKRAFIGYSDSQAGELGTIYQACNFEYLGDNFGNKYLFKHKGFKNGRPFSTQSLKRTSAFKTWCNANGVPHNPEWFNPNGFKNLDKIPMEIQDKWREWIRKIIAEGERIPISRKGKYVLVIGCDKRDERRLYRLKNFKSIPYPKRITA